MGCGAGPAEIDLSDMSLSDAELQTLCDRIAPPPPAAAATAAGLLPPAHALRGLALHDNRGLSDAVGEALARVALACSGLVRLTLRGTSLSAAQRGRLLRIVQPRALSAAAAAFAPPPAAGAAPAPARGITHLEGLFLDDSHVQQLCAAASGAAARGGPAPVSELDLRGSPALSDEAGGRLLALVQAHPALHTLRLGACGVGAATRSALDAALAQNAVRAARAALAAGGPPPPGGLLRERNLSDEDVVALAEVDARTE